MLPRVSWVGTGIGHANGAFEDGRGMGKVDLGGHCASTTLVELLDL